MAIAPDHKQASRILRFKALLFDWLLISAYLVVLSIVALVVYQIVFAGIPEFSALQTQLIATFASVVPIILIFSIMEGTKDFASWGKKKVNLRVVYKANPLWGSMIRNTLKFLPWQLGHMSTINGIYNGFNTPFSIVYLSLSIGLAAVYILSVFIRSDQRHPADLLAKSMIVRCR